MSKDFARPHSAAGNNVIADLAAARAAKANITTKKTEIEPHAIVAGAVIEVAIRRTGRDIMLTEGDVWLYNDGIWHPMTPADHQWIMTRIQEAFGALNYSMKTNSLNACYKRITEHPDLFQGQVPWADGSVIVCQNGVLQIESREFLPHSPKHYARRKIGAAYVPGTDPSQPEADCPQFIGLLNDIFADRSSRDQHTLKLLIQEFFGAALATKFLSREERKALILVGPSRTAKTELARFLRLLVGSPIATTSVSEISGQFGLASFYDAAAWIRDDAVNEGDELDAQRFKTIITGEAVDINRKHKDAVTGVELAIPVLLTANSLPRARDKSDAIFNRSLIVEMTRVFSDQDAHKMRQRLNIPSGVTPAAHTFSIEGSGILNWALAGLKRLSRRGRYNIPPCVVNATQRFKDDNNPVGEWARTCIERAPDDGLVYRVHRDDIMCAYHGWQREQDGDAARALGARGLFPRLRAAAPWVGDYTDANGRRYLTGVQLTDEGLQLWEAHHSGQQLKGGSSGMSETRNKVNKITAARIAMQSEIEDKTPRFPEPLFPETQPVPAQPTKESRFF
jgi:P4 family phage/plasmid primase-like protien